MLNPNWPLVETAWGPLWDAGGGRIPPDRYVEVRPIGQFATGRGRQYQLDQVQAGTSSMVLPNTNGSLDPDNTAGPFAGRILPFQPIRRRAQCPPTVNLLNQAQATGGDVGGQPLGVISTADDGPRVLSGTDTAPQFVASGTAWQGGTVAQFAVGTGAAAGAWICYTEQPAVLPGQTYTMQMRVRCITPGVTVQVAAAFRTRTATDTAATTAAGATASLVGSATAAWTTVTVTATAGATSAWMQTGLQAVATPGTAATVQVDGWQLEKGAAASAWVLPGVWYPVTGQFVERWPADWTDSGTRGIVSPTGVDVLALLSQYTLADPLTEEINRHNPRFLFRLDDPQGSEAAADATGHYAPAPVKHSKYGPGIVTFGTDITAADAAGAFTGAPGPVLNLTNTYPGTNAITAASYLSLDAVGIRGPANPQGAWTRALAFRYTGPPPSAGNNATMWSMFDARRPDLLNVIQVTLNDAGLFSIALRGPSAATPLSFTNPFTGRLDDANWHFAMFCYDPAADTFTTQVDTGYAIWSGVNAEGQLPAVGGLVSDSFGNYVDTTKGAETVDNWSGDLAFACEFPSALTLDERTRLYLAWKASFSGESTGSRYARILSYAGYQGTSRIDNGQTTSMGPANIGGQDAVSALQAVVDTEGGSHYVDGAGRLVFADRGRRYNALTPQFVFGERTGEWPYEACQPDFDSTHLGGIVQVTQESTGQVFTATDDASVTAYFPRTLTRTVNALDPLECQDAAAYLGARYAQPATRVAALKLHPSAYPALWPVCLSLEQGTRIRVMRRPLGAPPIQIEAFVEKLDWSQTDGGDAVLTLQASRADTTLYGLFAAWHTTLKAAVLAGATTITVNASADTVNPLAVQLAAGQQLVLGQGTANQETVTVKSVGATAPGWTSAVITLTAATAHSHAVGEWVNEPLPTGVTDPTAYDAVSGFDQVAFAY